MVLLQLNENIQQDNTREQWLGTYGSTDIMGSNSGSVAC